MRTQSVIEGIILRRIYENRIVGYTLEMAKEINDTIRNHTQQEHGERIAKRRQDNEYS